MDLNSGNNKFKIIAITPERYPTDINAEIESVEKILIGGCADFVHLRHRGVCIDDLRRILNRLPESLLSVITLHDHFCLAEEFAIGGLHLNSRNPCLPDNINTLTPIGTLRISRSCHSLSEVKLYSRKLIHFNKRNSCFIDSENNYVAESDAFSQYNNDIRLCGTIRRGYDYLTLSPIYDSISKEGYKSSFERKDLENEIRNLPIDVIALGGVTPDKFEELKAIGFAGAAMLGYFFGK